MPKRTALENTFSMVYYTPPPPHSLNIVVTKRKRKIRNRLVIEDHVGQKNCN